MLQVPLLPASQIICQAALPVRRCLQLRLAQPACCVKQAPLLESARAASSKTHVTRHRPCTWLAWSSCVQQPRVLSLGDSVLGRSQCTNLSVCAGIPGQQGCCIQQPCTSAHVHQHSTMKCPSRAPALHLPSAARAVFLRHQLRETQHRQTSDN